MKNNLNPSRAGFSLVELLAVMVIIAVLASFGFGTYMLVNKNARVTQAKVMIENLTAAIEARSGQDFSATDLNDLSAILESGTRYPKGDGSDTSTDGLYAYLSGDYDSDGEVDDDRNPMFSEIDPQYDGKGKYLNAAKLIVDPWQTPLRYEFPGAKNNVEEGFDLWSAGPDKEFDTDDDIKNW